MRVVQPSTQEPNKQGCTQQKSSKGDWRNTMTTQALQHRFDAAIVGTEVRGQRVMLKLDWKLPGSKFDFTMYVSPEEAETLNVGDRLNWSISRGSLKDGKDGKYSTDYFWDWDKEGSATSRASPTAGEGDWEDLGAPNHDQDEWQDDSRSGEPIQNQPSRSESPNAGQDNRTPTEIRIDKGMAFNAAIALVANDPAAWTDSEYQSVFDDIRQLRDQLYRDIVFKDTAPEHYCYDHKKPRSNNYITALL